MKWMILLFTVSFFGIACTDDTTMQEPLQGATEMTKNKTQNVDKMMSKEMNKIKETVAEKASMAKEMAATNNTSDMYVTPSLLNVRSGPGVSNAVTRTLSFKSKVNVMSNTRGWAKIGDNEYVYSKFLSGAMPTQINDPAVNTPVQLEQPSTDTTNQ